MSYQAESQSTINEVLLLIAVLQRIPKNRWVSSTEIRKGLAAEGIDLMPRRLQRFLVALVECEAFHIEVDRRGKPYGYRRNAPDSTLAESSLTPQESLLLRLCQERLKYQLPPCITEAMEPLFSASKTALNENGKSAKTREWLQKVAFVSDTVPMMPPKIKPRIFNAVSEALYRDSKLRVKFHNSRGEENEAVVSPLGLVQQVQRLYLICQFEGYNNIRHLALHRMDEAEVTAFPSVRPQDFSLSQYVASRHFNYSNGGKIHLLIEFTNPETAVNLSETPFNPTQTLQQLEDGAWRLEADMDDTVQLTGWMEAWRERGGFRKVEKTPIEA